MLKVKGVFWTLVIIVVLWAAASVLTPDEILPPKKNRDDERILTLLVKFEPSPRGTPVHIAYKIGGGDIENFNETTSPWTKTVPVPYGVGVVLWGQQMPSSGVLDCAISDSKRRNLIWDTTERDTAYPDSVVCEVRG